jgi:hypothetical protein
MREQNLITSPSGYTEKSRAAQPSWLIGKLQLARWLPLLSASLFIALWLWSYLAHGLCEALNFDGFPADGPFQLFNPLRRIADGQTGGVDFQFFHGLGVPYLHYPLFWLFGKTIFASELSRHITSLLCFIISLSVFAFVATNRDLRKTVCFFAFAACLAEFLYLDERGSVENLMVTAGNSLLGVRSTFPIISFALLISEIRPSLKAVLVGTSFALSLFLGTEHGLSLIASFVLVWCFVLARLILAQRQAQSSDDEALSFRFFLLTLVSTLGAVALLYLTFCGFKGGLQALRYNLIEVPQDQFWYFGVPPNDFASSWTDFFRASGRAVFLILALLLWSSVSLLNFVSNRNTSLSMQKVTLTHMLCYGAASCASSLGMLEKGYFIPMLRIVLLAMLLLAFRENWPGRILSGFGQQKSLLKVVALSAAIALGVSCFAVVSVLLMKRLPLQANLEPGQPLPHLSVLWRKYMAQVSSAIDQQQGKPRIWSTYSGLLEDHYQVFHPKDDYIIHALGPERRKQYLETFRSVKPEIVQTIRRSLFIVYTEKRDYEQWLRNTTWDFYEEILNNYEILTTTDRSFIWKRKTALWVMPSEDYASIPLNPGSDYLEIPSSKLERDCRLLVVKLRYKTDSPWRRLPVLGALPRYLVIPEQAMSCLPISLPPYASEIRFPVVIRPGTAPRLKFQTHSLIPGASFTVTEAFFKAIEVTEKQALFLED